MKHYIVFAILLIYSPVIFAQTYNRNSICGTDTVDVDYRDRMIGRVQYKAFECTRVSKVGVRVELGFNRYSYNAKTKNWLGNHNGGMLGLGIAYMDFTVGARFKPATVNPKRELYFSGELLTTAADVNPVKVEYDVSYSINLKHNLSIEPYVALTRNSFFVINEDELGKKYDINKTNGFTIGAAVNKYIHIKDFQFSSVFARYGYGLSDFRRINSDLGVGYSDLVIGIAYKGFGKQRFHKRL